MPHTRETIEKAARALLDAMDAQYGHPLFSQNVEQARGELRRYLPATRDLRDKSRERKAS